MDAEILAVGTELLMGQISNTNAQYISKGLQELGINVYYHSVVGDNPNRLTVSFEHALSRADIILITGGLGPTMDDLTKETVAEALGKELVLDQESLDSINSFFLERLGKVPENNIKQAYVPKDSVVLRNDRGTAPGILIDENGKIVVMMPGPPTEMRGMFDNLVMPYLREKTGLKIVSKFLRVFGVGESVVEDMLIGLIEKQTNPTIATYAKEGEVTIRVSARCEKEEDGESILRPVIQEIENILGDNIYSEEDETLPEVVKNLLIRNGMTLSIAESCTGGMISEEITSISGVSECFDMSYITYSNRAKIENLGVEEKVIEEFGAVSYECAKQMAIQIQKLSGSTIGLSVTGIAGPDGGTEEKPVGTVFVALADFKGNAKIKHLKLTGNREKIRKVTTLNSMDMIRRHIEEVLS